MDYKHKIFESIKSEVHKVLPDSKVLLFGSRVNGNTTDESDWDILILISEKPDYKIRKLIHNKLFPISVQIASFINTIIVSETDWNNNPSYYSLHKSVSSKKVIA